MKTVRMTFPVMTAAVLLGLTTIAPLRAQSTGGRSQVELGTYGAFTRYNTGSLGLASGFGAGGRLAYFLTPTFSFEASGDFTQTEQSASGTGINVTRLGGTLFAQRSLVGAASVFLGAGFERLAYRAGDTFDDNGFHLAIGNRLPIGGRAVLRLEGRAAYFPSSPRQIASNRVMNLGATAGLSIFSFGGPQRDNDRDGVRDRNDTCAETPFGALVDQAGCPTDEDADAVFDGFDQCMGTPIGASVNQAGCPSDSDTDTVLDGLDACPTTPMGATVGETGCPSDTDGDGIFNGLDQCDGTPPGALTDVVGCPLDTDGDLVFDGLDRCPATATGTEVDENGCASDTDLDGVFNDVDACPNTPMGSQVDATGCIPADTDRDGINDTIDRCPNTAPGQSVDNVGCPVLFVMEAGEVQPLVLQGVTFATGRSSLTDDSFEVLNQVAISLLAHPEVKLEIGGHTDATGRLSTNMRLSQGRAEAVLAYLARRGVEATQMTAVGFGPDQPIATNETADGRRQNRRVELRQIN